MRTNSLKKLIQQRLKTVGSLRGVYYKRADEDAMYPHAVFSLVYINSGDVSRSDYELEIDLWDKSGRSYDIEEIADEIEDLLGAENLPQDDILPTFYKENRKTVEDDDKKIDHRQLTFTVQLYERK